MKKAINQIVVSSLLAFALILQTPVVWADDFAQMAQSQLATYMLMKDMNLGSRSRLKTVSEKVSQAENGIDFVEIVLEQAGVGTIRLMAKGPRGFSTRRDKKLRSLFVASGLFAGRETVKLVNSLEDMVIVGYEYPYNAEQMARRPALAYEFMKQTPAQIAASLQWLSERTWQNPYEIYTIGVSLGGLFLPSALHIAQTINVPVKGSIFAYTGAELKSVLTQGLREHLPPEAVPLSITAVNALTVFHDPALHLPYLRGQFLTIRSDRDQVFPAESSIRIEKLLPEPKRVEVVSGAHINTDQTELIVKTQDLILNWLGSL